MKKSHSCSTKSIGYFYLILFFILTINIVQAGWRTPNNDEFKKIVSNEKIITKEISFWWDDKESIDPSGIESITEESFTPSEIILGKKVGTCVYTMNYKTKKHGVKKYTVILVFEYTSFSSGRPKIEKITISKPLD